MSDDIKKWMEEFDNRKKYTSFDEETLNSIEDRDLEQAIADYIYFKIGDDFSMEREYEVVTSLSKGVQAVYTTRQAEMEINNGGFHQYFWNSTGQFAMEAIDGFGEIGAPKAADLMERAVAIATDEFPQMRKYRTEVKGILNAFAESAKRSKLHDLDLEFYDLDEDLPALRVKYIRKHPEEFVGD